MLCMEDESYKKTGGHKPLAFFVCCRYRMLMPGEEEGADAACKGDCRNGWSGLLHVLQRKIYGFLWRRCLWKPACRRFLTPYTVYKRKLSFLYRVWDINFISWKQIEVHRIRFLCVRCKKIYIIVICCTYNINIVYI